MYSCFFLGITYFYPLAILFFLINRNFERHIMVIGFLSVSML